MAKNIQSQTLLFPPTFFDAIFTLFAFLRGWLFLLIASPIFLLRRNNNESETTYRIISGPGRSGTTFLRKFIQDKCYTFSFSEQSYLFTYTSIIDLLSFVLAQNEYIKIKYFKWLMSRMARSYYVFGHESISLALLKSTIDSIKSNKFYKKTLYCSDDSWLLLENCLLNVIHKANPDTNNYSLKLFDKTPSSIFNLPYLAVSRAKRLRIVYTLRNPNDTCISAKSAQGRSLTVMAIRVILSHLNLLILLKIGLLNKFNLLLFDCDKSLKYGINHQNDINILTCFFEIKHRKVSIDSLAYFGEELMGDSNLNHHSKAFYGVDKVNKNFNLKFNLLESSLLNTSIYLDALIRSHFIDQKSLASENCFLTLVDK